MICVAGVAVGGQLALPLLQERLDAKALEYAAERAKEAESEIIKMEVRRQAAGEGAVHECVTMGG